MFFNLLLTNNQRSNPRLALDNNALDNCYRFIHGAQFW